MNLLAGLKFALGSLALLTATASGSPPEASTEDVIKAMESIGFEGNRTMMEMVSLVAQKVSEKTGARMARRLALEPDEEVYVACGADLHFYEDNNELGSLASPSADGCMILCISMIKNCDAVTWTDYNGGTCWFKYIGGRFGWLGAVPKTGAISYFTHFKAFHGVTHRTFVNMDMIGNDLYSETGVHDTQDSSYCTGKCHLVEGCFASTWTDYNGGTCWYKSKPTTLVAKPGAVSSLHFYPMDSGLCK